MSSFDVAPLHEGSPVRGVAWTLAQVRHRIVDHIALTKPRLSSLVLVTTAGGYLLAPGAASAQGLLTTVILTALVVGAAQTLNCWMERDVDALMLRTRTRPLPAGRLSPNAALVQGLALAFLSVPWLAAAVNPLTGFLALLALWSYVGVYTPLKRVTSLSTIVGAVPGALPPLIGWTAATGGIALPGLVLFAVLFLWQVPHFLALSLFLEEDFARGGIAVLPREAGPDVTRAHILGWSLALVPTTVLLWPLGIAGRVYGLIAALLGTAFLGFVAFGVVRRSGRGWAGGVFASTIVHLTLLFAALALDASG